MAPALMYQRDRASWLISNKKKAKSQFPMNI